MSSAVGEIVPSLAVSVAALSDGRYFVSHLFRPSQIVSYETDGQLLGIYDAQGSGPGEFRRSPALFVKAGDTLIAVAGTRAVTLTDNLSHVRTQTMPMRIGASAVLLPSGVFVVDTPVSTNAGGVYLLNLVTLEGEVIRNLDLVDGRERGTPQPVIGPSGQDGFWSVPRGSSDLVHWTTDGLVEERLSIGRSWFEPWEDEVPGEPFTVRPRPRVSALGGLGENRLLVITQVADETWRSMSPQGAGGQVALDPTAVELSELWDSVVEIVDTRTGAVMARRRVDDVLAPVEGTDDRFYSTREDSLGHVVVDIWRVSFMDPGNDNDSRPGGGGG